MKKQIPNMISGLRILLAPVILVLVLRGNFEAATLLYLFGLLTDLLDGYVARKLGVQNQFGIWFDPFCSVVLFYTTAMALVFAGQISVIYPALIAAYSVISGIVERFAQGVRLKRVLKILAIVIGGGLGDFGLGLLMSRKYLGSFAIPVIVLALLVALYKNCQILTKKFLLDKYGEI